MAIDMCNTEPLNKFCWRPKLCLMLVWKILSILITGLDKTDKILTISMPLVMFVLSLVSTPSVMAATNTLAYQQGFSNQYNQGFSDGYNSLDLPLGKHTQDYLAGYKAGVSSIQYIHGYVEGYNGLTISLGNHSLDYLSGYKAGTKERAVSAPPVPPLPAHTNDKYKDFYGGYDDGAVAADNDNSSAKGVGFHGCPAAGHSQEYWL